MTHERDSETLTSDIREPVGYGNSIQKYPGPEGGVPGEGCGRRCPNKNERFRGAEPTRLKKKELSFSKK